MAAVRITGSITIGRYWANFLPARGENKIYSHRTPSHSISIIKITSVLIGIVKMDILMS